MLHTQEIFIGKNGTSYTLRSPELADAEKMIAYLKTTAEETEYGLSYPEELNFTIKDEEDFITHYTSDKGSIMISAFDRDRLVGNASLSCVMDRKKTLHRATFGIAILKSDWGQGLGKKILCSYGVPNRHQKDRSSQYRVPNSNNLPIHCPC